MGNLAVLPSLPLARTLAGLRLAPRIGHKALTAWPLLPAPSGGPRERAWITLGRALDDGFAGVEETAPAGSAMRVRVENRSALPLLVAAGEEVACAREALVSTGSVGVPPRGAALVDLARADERQRRMSRDLLAWLREIRPLPGQVGVVAALGDRVLGLELTSCPLAFADLLPGLLARFWMRAVEIAFRCGPASPPRFDAPETFLGALGDAELRSRASAGLGREILLEGSGLSGRALVVGEDVVHQVALAR
jgi:hypothetical protein